MCDCVVLQFICHCYEIIGYQLSRCKLWILLYVENLMPWSLTDKLKIKLYFFRLALIFRNLGTKKCNRASQPWHMHFCFRSKMSPSVSDTNICPAKTATIFSTTFTALQSYILLLQAVLLLLVSLLTYLIIICDIPLAKQRAQHKFYLMNFFLPLIFHLPSFPLIFFHMLFRVSSNLLYFISFFWSCFESFLE